MIFREKRWDYMQPMTTPFILWCNQWKIPSLPKLTRIFITQTFWYITNISALKLLTDHKHVQFMFCCASVIREEITQGCTGTTVQIVTNKSEIIYMKPSRFLRQEIIHFGWILILRILNSPSLPTAFVANAWVKSIRHRKAETNLSLSVSSQQYPCFISNIFTDDTPTEPSIQAFNHNHRQYKCFNISLFDSYLSKRRKKTWSLYEAKDTFVVIRWTHKSRFHILQSSAVSGSKS